MRDDNFQFKAANEQASKSPRYVVAILFDTASIYITSHDDITSVPGVVLEAALLRPSAISQRIIPDEGRSEIGTFSFDIVDEASGFTDEIRNKLNAGAGLRGRTVQLWVGYRGMDFTAFQRFQTQIVTDCQYHDGVYSVNCNDITRQQRTSIFDPVSTTLAASCSADDTTITVADTSKLFAVAHGPNWSDGPNGTFVYFQIEKEVIRGTVGSSTTLVGCTRGEFNTLKAPHVVDPSTPQERRPKVTEFIYLELPAPKLALALLTGAILRFWPANILGADGGFETDTNADGIGNGWTLLVNGGDGARVQTASRPAGSSPFVGSCQRLAITSVGNSNPSRFRWTGLMRSGLTITFSGYVRTNAAAKVKIQITFLNASGVTLSSTAGANVAGDSVIHFTQVTATAPAGTDSVQFEVTGINAASEFMECDQLMAELGSTPHAYTVLAVQGLLPEHWHMGIQPELIDFDDFLNIGTDLWLWPDDSQGFITRFEGLTKSDGKQFLERQLYLLLGAYQPVYADGTLGLKRLPAMVSTAAPVAVLTERECISVEPLQHDYSSLHNRIRVSWGFDIALNDYTRDTLFIDATSVGINGESPLIEYQFRGLHPGAHTDNVIRTRLDAIRDAYSYPPERTSITVLNSLNRFETGDVFRLQVANVRDFAGPGAHIDRSFLALYRSLNFETGDITFELFGSTLRPPAQAPSTEVTAPLPDAFYTSQGVALNTVIGMTGNTVNVGTHSLPGNADMTASGAIYYHNGDLVIPNGATINIANNVQLRVKGFITMNGIVNGKGGGLAGVADPGGALTTPVPGNPGFIGNSRGWDGVDVQVVVTRSAYEQVATVPCAFTKGRFEAWPDINLTVSGSTLNGLPTDLRGTGGGPGGRALRTYDGSTFNAGAGANGGAGLVIICRGISFGVSAMINLDGNDSATTTKVVAIFPDIFPGAGGAGGPGACLIVLDGNLLGFPNAAGRFSAKCGVVPLQGVPLPARFNRLQGDEFGRYFPDGIESGAWVGYADEQNTSGLDLSEAALRIKFLPYTQTPGPDQPTIPPPIAAFDASGGPGYITVFMSDAPTFQQVDVVELWASIDNNRANAVRVGYGAQNVFQVDVPPGEARWFWARTVRFNDPYPEQYSAWFPVSPTAGVTATSQNAAGWTPKTVNGGTAHMVVSTTSAEKSGGSDAYDSQVYSNDFLLGLSLQFRANDATHELVFGIDQAPSAHAPTDAQVDYAFRLQTTGNVRIVENGTDIGAFGTYTAATQFEIRYDGERVTYLKDGVVQRSVITVAKLFYLDSSFKTPGGKVVDLRFVPLATILPAFPLGSVNGGTYMYGSTIEKVAGTTGFNASITSAAGFASGAFTSGRCVDTSHALAFGLTADPSTDDNYTSIDYCWHFTASGAVLRIYENGTYIGDFGTYSSSTVCSIRDKGGAIEYIKDGVVVRTVPRSNTSPLYFDSSFYTIGGQLLDTRFETTGNDGEADTSAFFLDTFEDRWEQRYTNQGNSASVVVDYPNDGLYGGKVIRAQNQLWIELVENIPYDPTFVYRITGRIRRTAAASSGASTELVDIGVVGVGADGTTLINESGSNSHSSQFFNCARSFDMSAIAVNTYKDFVGYFSNTGTSGFGVAAGIYQPTPLYTGVKYIRPVLRMSMTAGNGTMECDFIKIERLLVPDDADNTDKQRLVPDGEFSSTTPTAFWAVTKTGATGSAVFSASGGLIDGKLTLTNGDSGDDVLVRAIRNPVLQVVGVKGVQHSIRVRRLASLGAAMTLQFQMLRSATTDFSTVTVSTTVSLTLDNTSLPTTTDWYTFDLSSRIFATPATRPYATVRMVLLGSSGAVGQVVEIDAFNSFITADQVSATAAGLVPILPSGAAGKASLLDTGGFGVLAEAGVKPAYTDADTSTSYTVGAGDNGTVRRFTSASAITVTVPNSTPTDWSIGQKMRIIRGGTGTLTVAAAGGATTRAKGGGLAVTAQNGYIDIMLVASGVWQITGDN